MTILRIASAALAFSVMVASALAARADGLSSDFNTNKRQLETSTAQPGANSSLNPQPLPPHPGDPNEKSGIIIVGGKNKAARIPTLSPKATREHAGEVQK